jgi:hypothetical protein
MNRNRLTFLKFLAFQTASWQPWIKKQPLEMLLGHHVIFNFKI